jgi:hypothetical protein
MCPRNTCLVELSVHAPVPRDDLRYRYTHSILRKDNFRGVSIPQGQRLSIMIRLSASLLLDDLPLMDLQDCPPSHTLNS